MTGRCTWWSPWYTGASEAHGAGAMKSVESPVMMT